ncbi:hypothetical protein [Candidatus Palauibacter sp.]|uniref:hypothetical protein n=1 Tax=Candidatus Palauibacter sp. TaxID=3101350 RepID=UPI003AF29D05
MLGGPFLQLAVPFFITFRLWRRGEAVPAAVGVLWSAESVIGDHRHDWRQRLERAGALDSAEEIGLTLHLLASAAALGAVWWTICLEANSRVER